MVQKICYGYHYSLCCPIPDEVEVILVEGGWPNPNHALWKLMSLRVVVCVTLVLFCQTKGRKKAQSMPKGWSTIRTYDIHHNDVGRVTNRCFKVEVCGVSGLKLLMTPPTYFLGVLVDVLDPLVICCPKQNKIPLPGNPNTFCGILD